MPRYIPAEGEKAVGPAAEANTDIADLTGTATILLVEDEEAVRAFAARALQSRGYKVYEASSGVEALEVMKETGGSVDLIVSRRGHARARRTVAPPRAAQDAAGPEDHLRLRLRRGRLQEEPAGGEDFHFLPKPFSLKQLAIAVKAALQG